MRDITDRLDSVGNTTAAMGKGFAIGSAALTAMALFVSYAQAAELQMIDILDPFVIIGLLLGGDAAVPVQRAHHEQRIQGAESMIREVRRQFKEHAGILKGTERPGLPHLRIHRGYLRAKGNDSPRRNSHRCSPGW